MRAKKQARVGRLLPLALAFAVFTAWSVSATADMTGAGSLSAPTLQLEVDNTSGAVMWAKDLSSYLALDVATGAWTFTQDYHLDSGAKLADGVTSVFSIDIKANQNYGNIDPFINYSIAFKNNSVNSIVFNRVFNAPIAPNIIGGNTVLASIGGMVTDGNGNGVTITAAPATGISQDSDGISEVQILRLHSATTNTWTNAGVDVGLTQSYAGSGVHSYGVYNDGPIAGPLGNWDQMQVHTRFTLTGGGDTASLSGYAEILPVPEPATWATLGIGLFAIGCVARRNKML